MAGDTSVDPGPAAGRQPSGGEPGPLRALVQVQRRGADAHQGRRAVRGAERAAQRAAGQLLQQYRPRRWDTRAGAIDLAIPTLRQGYLQNSWKMPGVQIRQIWNGARIDQNRA